MARRPRVIGFTKCPGCSQPLNDGRPTTDVETEEYGWGTSPSGKAYRRITPTKVTITWHTECLDDFAARNDRLRDRERVDNLAGLYTAFVVGGAMTADQFLTSTRKTGSYSEDDIAAAIAQAGGQQ